MPSMRMSLVSGFCLLLTLLSSCTDQPDEGLLTGVKTVLNIPNGTYELRVSYDPPVGEKYFAINCKRPNDQGLMGPEEIPTNQKGSTVVTLPLPQKPGQYTITCRDNAGNQAEASFSTKGEVMVENDVAIKPIQPEGGQEPAGSLSSSSSKYALNFDPTKAAFETKVQSQVPIPFGCWNQALTWWPSITKDNEGKLEAHCSYTSDAGTVFSGTMTGLWDAGSGVLSIEVSDVSVVPQNGKWADGTDYSGKIRVTTTIKGTGKFMSDTTAQGTADFSQECEFVEPHPYASGCTFASDDSGSKNGLKISGTVPFTFKFSG